MKSPLEYLVEQLNQTQLGQLYSLETVIYDDDPGSTKDCGRLGEYGFYCQTGSPWIFPETLSVDGQRLNAKLHNIPSTYRRLALDSAPRITGKRQFEAEVLQHLLNLEIEIVLLDGLLIILDQLILPPSPYYRKVFNIHPGITQDDSPYQRRGAYATLDALHAARGERIINWQSMEKQTIPPVQLTGASFHYVDTGIDSGEVIADVLNTHVTPTDTILELRWNNFNQSLFPAMINGLKTLSGISR